MASILISTAVIGLLIFVTFWVSNKFSEIRTMEIFYPFDLVLEKLSGKTPFIGLVTIFSMTVLVGMLVTSGAGTPLTSLVIYSILGIAIAIDFDFSKSFYTAIISILTFITLNLWFFSPSWISFNITTVIACAYIIATISFKNLRTFGLIGLALMLFDAIAILWGDLGSRTLMGQSLPPTFFLVPKDPLNLNMRFENLRAVLGMTDVIILGLAFKYAQINGSKTNTVKLFALASIFITLGLSKLTGETIPALLVIVPAMWLALKLKSI